MGEFITYTKDRLYKIVFKDKQSDGLDLIKVIRAYIVNDQDPHHIGIKFSDGNTMSINRSNIQSIIILNYTDHGDR